MKLEAISLEQLANYLYGIETSQNMVDITKISISKKDKKQGIAYGRIAGGDGGNIGVRCQQSLIEELRI